MKFRPRIRLRPSLKKIKKPSLAVLKKLKPKILLLNKLKQKKYAFYNKKLGLKKLKTKKKFVIAQIDGLSHDLLKFCIKKRITPFIRKLTKKYNVTQFNCGLPSNTPAFQANVLFGSDKSIPGLNFFDRKLRKTITTATMEGCKFIEDHYLDKSKQVLKKGSCYGAVFTAGAERPVLTMSALGEGFIFSRFNNYEIGFFILLNPFLFFRVVGNSFRELFAEFGEVIGANIKNIFRKKKAFNYSWLPFRFMFMKVIMREIQKIGTLIDINRGVSSLFVNFAGYDDVAHFRGPKAKSALESLREIDKAIKSIYKESKQDYDFFILSDHGMTQSKPFSLEYGQSFDAFIYSVSENIQVCESGNLANLYLKSNTKRLEYQEMPQKFIRKIVAHPGIGFLVVKDGTKIRLISKKGQMIIENNVITGKDFISHLGDVRIITNQIKNLSKMKNVGDLVVFGNYDGKRVVSFVDNFGTHSGLGGEQSNAFFISKNKVDLSKETSSKVLHKLFSAY